jgi:integrase
MVKKTFFITLYQTGMRPGELRTIKWGNIRFEEGNLTSINCFMTKNKKHKTVYVDEATFFLKKLQESAKSEYVFPSREKKRIGDKLQDCPITDSTATLWIQKLGQHINKKIYPYLLRHTRSQELYSLADEGKLSETMVAKFLGHSLSMRNTYAKISQKGLKDASMKVIYRNEELPPERKHRLELDVENLTFQNKKLHEIIEMLVEEQGKQRARLDFMQNSEELELKIKEKGVHDGKT